MYGFSKDVCVPLLTYSEDYLLLTSIDILVGVLSALGYLSLLPYLSGVGKHEVRALFDLRNISMVYDWGNFLFMSGSEVSEFE